MSEHSEPKEVKITTVKKEKDPRRVEAGKRLAAISRQAKEKKTAEQSKASEASKASEGGEQSTATTGEFCLDVYPLTALGLAGVVGYALYYRYFSNNSKTEVSTDKTTAKTEKPTEVSKAPEKPKRTDN